MKKVSAESSFFMKKIFPLLWFGFIGIFLVSSVLHGWDVMKRPMFLVVPCLMAVIGYYLMKATVWDLVDEVYDCGDSLLVKKDGQEEIVPFSNIMNVNVLTTMNPPRITLRLVQGGKLGSEISFLPRTTSRSSPLWKVAFQPAKNEVAEDLIIRVDRARSQRTA